MKKRFKMVQVEEFYIDLTREKLLSLKSAMRGGNAANNTVMLMNHVAKGLDEGGQVELSRTLRERAQFLQAGIDMIDNILDTPCSPQEECVQPPEANNHADLVDALKMARARIEYLGAVCTNPKHFNNNAEVVLPKIDAVLAAVSSPGERS